MVNNRLSDTPAAPVALELMTVPEAAALVGVSQYALYCELRAGRLLCVRLGARRRNVKISRRALELWQNASTGAWRSSEVDA
jgi:excisionase family DNA binding protein